MGESLFNQVITPEHTSDKPAGGFCDYSDLLREMGIAHSRAEFYLEVGEIKQVQGWILHLSVIRTQMLALFQAIIPVLVEDSIPFRIIRDSETARYLMNANFGYERLGKILGIYPAEGMDIVALSQRLIALTADFRGPAVPTDCHLGGIVYTRYGSYTPVLTSAGLNRKIRYIYNTMGEMVPDEYTIPFRIPAGIEWPFGAVFSPEVPAGRKLWKNTYKPLTVLKADAKGRVILGIYMKSLFSIKKCIIKEGISNMWADDFGRDIQDRLKWQFELNRELAGDIPVPRIFDLFYEGDDLYLVMEYIKGESLENIILSQYKGRCWSELAVEAKLELIDYLLSLIRIIKKLHLRGYVHRDITPNNFLIDKKKNIFLIDMELSYSIVQQKPSPPFRYGTPGYVSIEQSTAVTPTVYEDIYALGALMILVFTGVSSSKFALRKTAALTEKLIFFTGHPPVSAIITSCLSARPDERPNIDEIYAVISGYSDEVGSRRGMNDRGVMNLPAAVNADIIDALVNKGLSGLLNNDLLTPELLWDSQLPSRQLNGTELIERGYLGGIYNGMSGVLYMLAEAQKMGYNTGAHTTAYHACWTYIKENFPAASSTGKAGLYDGVAGIALAMSLGMDSGLLTPGNDNQLYITQAFGQIADGLTLAEGIAGQGIALLQCGHWMEDAIAASLLRHYTTTVLQAQSSDGSWLTDKTRDNKLVKVVGWANGVTGIIYFLLAYMQKYPDEQVVVAVKKALMWLCLKVTGKKLQFFEQADSQKQISFSCSDADIPGVAMVFINAYKCLGDQVYKTIAWQTLRTFSPHRTDLDFSQTSGLAGIGEVYLEAYDAFGDKEWMERTDWIAHTFYHTFLTRSDNYGHWAVAHTADPTAELMVGCSGIIRFLMRYRFPKKLGYLLMPRLH